MSTQASIERMAELQVREQEQKLKKAEYEAKLQLDHARKVLALPPMPGAPSGVLS